MPEKLALASKRQRQSLVEIHQAKHISYNIGKHKVEIQQMTLHSMSSMFKVGVATDLTPLYYCMAYAKAK